jgi:predicted RND superfamily exporter protein
MMALMQNNFEGLAWRVDEMGNNVADTDKLFGQWSKTLNGIYDTLKNKLATVLLEIGQNLAPDVARWMDSFGESAKNNRVEIVEFTRGWVDGLTAVAQGYKNIHDWLRLIDDLTGMKKSRQGEEYRSAFGLSKGASMTDIYSGLVPVTGEMGRQGTYKASGMFKGISIGKSGLTPSRKLGAYPAPGTPSPVGGGTNVDDDLQDRIKAAQEESMRLMEEAAAQRKRVAAADHAAYAMFQKDIDAQTKKQQDYWDFVSDGIEKNSEAGKKAWEDSKEREKEAMDERIRMAYYYADATSNVLANAMQQHKSFWVATREGFKQMLEQMAADLAAKAAVFEAFGMLTKLPGMGKYGGLLGTFSDFVLPQSGRSNVSQATGGIESITTTSGGRAEKRVTGRNINISLNTPTSNKVAALIDEDMRNNGMSRGYA